MYCFYGFFAASIINLFRSSVYCLHILTTSHLMRLVSESADLFIKYVFHIYLDLNLFELLLRARTGGYSLVEKHSSAWPKIQVLVPKYGKLTPVNLILFICYCFNSIVSKSNVACLAFSNHISHEFDLF